MLITYTGSLPAGELLDPATGVTYPFTRGHPITLPDNITLPASDWILDASPQSTTTAPRKPKPAPTP